ncbi:hypothetical protein CGCA056_v015155 [Colletotrichum aenigma]|nr:hypothetical protein CGCA056_v015155 [Colletotrichum aenigma]
MTKKIEHKEVQQQDVA